jgi:hypothetical protein
MFKSPAEFPRRSANIGGPAVRFTAAVEDVQSPCDARTNKHGRFSTVPEIWQASEDMGCGALGGWLGRCRSSPFGSVSPERDQVVG